MKEEALAQWGAAAPQTEKKKAFFSTVGYFCYELMA